MYTSLGLKYKNGVCARVDVGVGVGVPVFKVLLKMCSCAF